MQVRNKSTVYVNFTGEMPRKFTLKNSKGEVYFERFLDGKTPRIKFNIVHPDNYTGNVPFEVVKISPIEIPTPSIDLPPYERNRLKDFVIIDNPELEGTPARVFTQEGVIEKGKRLYDFPKPMRVFFLLHEVGHFFYKTEEYCDLFAYYHFLQMGYNQSTAMYCLTQVLRKNANNLERVKFLYNKIMRK